MTVEAAEAWLDRHETDRLDRLRAFLRIPSVSTDPAYASGMREAAAFLAAYVAEIGLADVVLHPPAVAGSHPILTAGWTRAGDAPTILVYGHYDVQPPDPLEAWASPPFEPTARDGRLYARGASDDKGPLLAALGAVEALMATAGSLPVNLRLLVEGSEEVGSTGLEEFVAAHPDLVRADFVLSADGAMWRADLPTVTVASRGMCALNLTVRGAAKDLHSGRYGGGVPNPGQVLAALVAGLHDPATGRGRGAGLLRRSRARPATRSAPPSPRSPSTKRAFSPPSASTAGAGEAGYGFLERNWLRPTLEVNGLSAGYTGPGFKTVIGATAEAKLSCRLVPGQDPLRILSLLEQDLRDRCPPGVTLSIERRPGVAWPSEIPADHPGLVLAMQVLEDLYGQPARRVQMGATIPLAEIFDRVMGMKTVFFSFSTADEDYHAPNEFFRLDALARRRPRLGPLPRPPRRP